MIVCLGFVGCPSTDDQVPKVATSNVVAKSSAVVDASNGDTAFPLSESIALVMLGSGLIGLAVTGRKRFKK